MSTFRCFSRLLILVLLLGVLPALGNSAHGQVVDDYKGHVDLAVQLFQRQYFEAALQEFQKAYAMTPAPRLLFNMGQALLKLGRPKDALLYFERYRQTDEARTEEAARLLSRTMADAQVQLEAERVIAEQTEKDRQDKLAAERAQAEKERKEKERLRSEREELSRKLRALVSAKSQRPPLSEPGRRKTVITMLALSGVALGLSLAGLVTLALDGYPACDRSSPQQLCPTHVESKLPGALVLGVGLASFATSQVVLGLSFRPTAEEQRGASLAAEVETDHGKPTP